MADTGARCPREFVQRMTTHSRLCEREAWPLGVRKKLDVIEDNTVDSFTTREKTAHFAVREPYDAGSLALKKEEQGV